MNARQKMYTPGKPHFISRRFAAVGRHCRSVVIAAAFVVAIVAVMQVAAS